MTACPWLLFNIVYLGVAVLAIISIWGQRRAHNRQLLNERTRFFRGEL